MNVKTITISYLTTNVYIVTDEASNEAAVIDCGEFTAELQNELEDKFVKYILLTHGHFDHILGVYALKQAHPEAKIIIHKADAECLEKSSLSLADDVGEDIQTPVTADMTVGEGDIIELGSIKFKLMSTPGHTKGSVCYYVESERTVFTGDTLFCLTVGRTDLPGGDDDEMLSSVTRLYNMDGDYTIYPGHNRATTMDYERRRNRYMRRFK